MISTMEELSKITQHLLRSSPTAGISDNRLSTPP
jgi:hypothetical protein